LGLGTVRLGLCTGVVPPERPSEITGLSGVRSICLAPTGQETRQCNPPRSPGGPMTSISGDAATKACG
ncbi:MAG: hypothetical protein WBO24_07350, partial [Nitrospirales bacterium]